MVVLGTAIIFELIITQQAYGQSQLVLLKREQVILRINPGDYLIYSVKNSREIRRSYITNLSDTAIIAEDDTVGLTRISRIYFHRPRFYNKAGVKIITAGVLLFLIDQVNISLVQGHKPSLSNGVSVVSLSLIGAGIPMALIRKKSQKLNRKYRLLVIKKGSVLYRDPR